MDYAKPSNVIASMIDAGELALSRGDLLIRGALSGALLGAATTLALTGVMTTGQPLVGALIFPVSLVMIVLLGLELVTGSFALVPLARLEGKASWNAVIANLSWVYLANLLGSIGFGVLIAISLTNTGKTDVTGVAARLVAVAEAKTIANVALGIPGMVSIFVKAVLVIPTGIMLGAKVSAYDWWVFNQIPVTIGNLLGGFVFTGLALYVTYKPANQSIAAAPVAAQIAAE